jgi:hypothetical protein
MAMNMLKARAVMSHILSRNGSGPQSNVLVRGSNIQYIAIAACLPGGKGASWGSATLHSSWFQLAP